MTLATLETMTMTSNRPDNNCTYTTPYANTHTSALCSVVERQRTVCCWVKPVCELLAPVFFIHFDSQFDT